MTLVLYLALALGADAPSETPATTIGKLLAELRATSCDAELSCWKRKMLRFDMGLESAALSLDSVQLRATFADAEALIWKAKATDQARAIDAIKPALSMPTLEPWHRSPVLWFALGCVTAVGLALGIFALAKRIDAKAGL